MSKCMMDSWQASKGVNLSLAAKVGIIYLFCWIKGKVFYSGQVARWRC